MLENLFSLFGQEGRSKSPENQLKHLLPGNYRKHFEKRRDRESDSNAKVVGNIRFEAHNPLAIRKAFEDGGLRQGQILVGLNSFMSHRYLVWYTHTQS